MRRMLGATLGLGLLAVQTLAHADPPRLRSGGSLREGLRVEACEGGACETWARFPQRPYRSFVEARVSPSGRFFYVWSKPDGAAREIDVFTVPALRGRRPERVGHWSPGAGGALEWTREDRLWHVWGCGTPCQMGALYGRDGAVLVEAAGLPVERSPDGRFALIVGGNHGGTLVDLIRATRRTFESPPEMTYGWGFRWRPGGVSVLFTSDSDGQGARRWVQVRNPPRPGPGR